MGERKRPEVRLRTLGIAEDSVDCAMAAAYERGGLDVRRELALAYDTPGVQVRRC